MRKDKRIEHGVKRIQHPAKRRSSQRPPLRGRGARDQLDGSYRHAQQSVSSILALGRIFPQKAPYLNTLTRLRRERKNVSKTMVFVELLRNAQ
jgi:hypothetical protein